MRLSLLLIGLLAATFASGAPAQRLEPPIAHVDRICVKVAEGTGARLRDGRLWSPSGADLRSVDSLFRRAVAEPLVTALSWERLDELHAEACDRLPAGRGPGHMGLWFRLRTASAEAASSLLEDLRAEPLVTQAYLEPICYGAGVGVMPDDLPPTTPSFTSLQLPHDPTPLGHGIRLSSGIFGARGQGVHFRMIETSWILDHEDMSQLVAANFIGPVPVFDPVYAFHGTQGASIVFADRNAYGLTGIADEVQANFVALELNGGIENSIMVAMSTSQPGDVLMFVLMVQIPQFGPGTWLPVEFYDAVFDATLTLTAAGRHVVAPAGNGNRSLDDPQLLRRFDRTFRDSGAIIVAASQAGLLQRAPYSNWGSRVDAHSWGEQVAACGGSSLFFGNNDLRQGYTSGAGGTSSATPHVAAIVAAIQGAARRQLGHLLTNTEVADLLHAHGPTTPDVIGRRPDLHAILHAMGAFDGLQVGNAEVALGGTADVVMDGPINSIVGLFASFGTADIGIGLNRNVHLDVTAMVPLDAFVLATGSAQWSWQLPVDPLLQGLDLYFQALRLDGAAPWHLTNSCQVSIL